MNALLVIKVVIYNIDIIMFFKTQNVCLKLLAGTFGQASRYTFL